MGENQLQYSLQKSLDLGEVSSSVRHLRTYSYGIYFLIKACSCVRMAKSKNRPKFTWKFRVILEHFCWQPSIQSDWDWVALQRRIGTIFRLWSYNYGRNWSQNMCGSKHSNKWFYKISTQGLLKLFQDIFLDFFLIKVFWKIFDILSRHNYMQSFCLCLCIK